MLDVVWFNQSLRCANRRSRQSARTIELCERRLRASALSPAETSSPNSLPSFPSKAFCKQLLGSQQRASAHLACSWIPPASIPTLSLHDAFNVRPLSPLFPVDLKLTAASAPSRAFAKYIEDNQDLLVERLAESVAIASVSGDASYRPEVRSYRLSLLGINADKASLLGPPHGQVAPG